MFTTDGRRDQDQKEVEALSIRAGTDSTAERKPKSIREATKPKPAQQNPNAPG